MSVLNETNHVGEYLVSEANGYRSVEEGTPAAALINPTAKIVSGTVVQLTSNEYTPIVDAASDDVGVLYTEIAEGETLSEVVVHARDCEVAAERLTYPAGFTAPQIAAAVVRLEAQGIKVV